jgi:GNAT superfamily N-acetyltransferase
VIRSSKESDASAVAIVHETARRAYYEAAEGRTVESAALVAAHPERLAMWEAVLRDPARASVLCAEVDDRVVAFLSMGPPLHQQPEDCLALELHALYVLPPYWGGGVGSRLHAQFAEELNTGPFTRGVLDVWSGNERAIAFYERRGWMADGRSRPAPDGTTYDGMWLAPVR